MEIRTFDLNIQKVLEHWSVAHAIREVISNALDEQALTVSQDPCIFCDEQGDWHIRDWGRGLRYEHLTQNENNEKLKNRDHMIGKFGVGLKDAFATFDRRRIGVTICTRHGDITIGKEHKHGFKDISTLHARIANPSNPEMNGTDVVLSGLKDEEMQEAKGFFLRYSGDVLLERTTYGEVLERPGGRKNAARIYVNGLRVAVEDNFLFSYNITSPTKLMLRALNRERINVGRTAYSERVKDVLLACESRNVADPLATDLQRFEQGTVHDELQWIDVAAHACRVLSAVERVIFVTSYELGEYVTQIDHARGDGMRIVIVPDNVRQRLPRLLDTADQPIRDLNQYLHERELSFQFNFVPVEKLNPQERAIWDTTPNIFRLAGGRPKVIRDVKISETMRPEGHNYQEALGLWDAGEGRIVIKRSELSDLKRYAGVLLHEIVHAKNENADDLTFEFVDGLTLMLGTIAAKHIAATPAI